MENLFVKAKMTHSPISLGHFFAKESPSESLIQEG